jgi:hypothetical protein
MIKTEIKKIEKEVVISYKCDICKKDFPIENYEETQEFHHINFVGGYSSVFGDGASVLCDICQHCLHDMIKDFANIREDFVWKL